MNGLRGAHAERVNSYGRPLQVAFTALLLTITGADGSALAAVVMPSEDHKWTLASVLALYGIDVSKDDVWKALPRASQEDVPCFEFIWQQVRAPVDLPRSLSDPLLRPMAKPHRPQRCRCHLAAGAATCCPGPGPRTTSAQTATSRRRW
jgi:hypothetical protein